jgi:hypothetical protein
MTQNRAVCPKCSQPVVLILTEAYDVTVIENQIVKARSCIDIKEIIECACAPFTFDYLENKKAYKITGVVK